MFKKYGKSFLDKEIAPGAEDAVHSLSTRQLPSATTYFAQESENSFPEEEEDDEGDDADITIGKGVHCKGELRFEKLLHIDGTFEGTIESGKRIIVGPEGVLKASITLDEAFIAGKVEGDLCIKERLVLRGRAEIYGNITTPSLSVDEGVTIVGQLLVSKAT